jgi:hypothetical protein
MGVPAATNIFESKNFWIVAGARLARIFAAAELLARLIAGSARFIERQVRMAAERQQLLLALSPEAPTPFRRDVEVQAAGVRKLVGGRAALIAAFVSITILLVTEKYTMPKARTLFRLPECDPRRFFDQGLTFEFAALELQRRSDFLTVATVVAINSTFSAELFLKALSALNGELPYKTHDLEVLFADLPDDVKARLHANWPTVFLGAQVMIDHFNRLHGLPKITLAVPDLEDAIAKARLAFEELRYPSNNSWINVNQRLPKLIRNEILARHPEWIPPDSDPRVILIKAI